MKPIRSRRKFMKKSIQLGLTIPLAGSALFQCSPQKSEAPKAPSASAAKPLSILILGGTSFLGPHQIAYAMGRGHSITTFTRGRTEPTIYPELFEKVTSLIGDRANDLTALDNGRWDAVIDNSGRDVEWARSSAALLKDKCDIYLYTSSTGVYYPYLDDNIGEDHELVLVEPEGIEDDDIKMEYWYGVMKANSEIAVKEEFGADRSILVRPTYMIGPADRTNRFIHWPVRLAKGGEIMVPGKSSDPVQYADVRDVAEWMIRLIEEKKAGTYNAVGPNSTQTMQTFTEEAASVFDVEKSFVNIDDYDFLTKQHVPYLIPWIMPVGDNYGSARISNEKCKREGMTFRNIRDTVKDTYDWWYSDALTDEQREAVEKDPESVLVREAEIIRAWRSM